jgi:hypothetical protein
LWRIGSQPVIVEVKETAPNEEERESDRLLAERGWGNAVGGTPGDRVRNNSCLPSAWLYVGYADQPFMPTVAAASLYIELVWGQLVGIFARL